MKKQDFINTVHANANLDISRKLTGEIIDTTFNELTGLLTSEDNNRLTYPGFGTFSIKARAERQGVNPRNPQGPKITIPASNTVGFKIAGGWKKDLTAKL